jgi:hypothetical protein
MSVVTAFNSAYPGSMFQKPDGDYIMRTDAYSLAGALVERVCALQNDLEDMTAAACQHEGEANALRQSRDELLEALKVYANVFNWDVDEQGIRRVWLEPGSTTPTAYNGFEAARAALAKSQPAQPAGEQAADVPRVSE